jgi:ATP-binding cassette subfamily G (WHITE) protein 2 (SNQ2)
VLPDGSTRRLLNNCYGYAAPGQMCALMGASGAGKSTLLDVLAGIKNQGTTAGELLVNGRPRDVGFTDIVGYVQQFDSHNPLSTIFEAVEFSGRLRLPSTVSVEDVKAKVWNVLRLLEIDHLASAIIGAPSTGGVAPEIRKKVTIAVELIMEPSILFLDEPSDHSQVEPTDRMHPRSSTLAVARSL